MAKKQGQNDYLKECMDSVEIDSTVDEFQEAFCSVCINPDCKRSQWSNSKWVQRMIRQEKALQNPNIVDPDQHPKFAELASQDFISVDEDQAEYYGGWYDVREDGKVVHQTDPPTETKPSEKVDESVSSLENQQNGKSESENDEVEEQKEVSDSDSESSTDRPSQFQKMPEPDEGENQKNETSNKEDKGGGETNDREKSESNQIDHPQNTSVPEGGIMLEPDEEEDSASQKESVLKRKEDKWSAPDEDDDDDSGLTVRIDEGEVVED